jgi:anti-sigma factor RsiW
MSAARDTATCRQLERWLTAYVDSELDAVHCFELEDHLGKCSPCSERVALLRACKNSVRQAAALRAPSALRERLMRSLAQDEGGTEHGGPADEASSDPQPISQHPANQHPANQRPVNQRPVNQRPANQRPANQRPGHQPQLVKLRYVVPLAAAATLALVFGAVQLRSAETRGNGGYASATTLPTTPIDSLVDELVTQHARPPRLEVTDPNAPMPFEPIGVRVRAGDYAKRLDARFEGGRENPRAAMLRYVRSNKNRMVTLYVFDTQRVPVRSSRLEARHVGARKVYVGHSRGYVVGATEQDGIGYALTADELTDDEATDLVLAAASR